ncbi:hypothetical protein FRC01_000970 [Tulasnella sp. 417]|nr:hypothetical protein FRC01_000970 [Tulasnella sp. 417]
MNPTNEQAVRLELRRARREHLNSAEPRAAAARNRVTHPTPGSQLPAELTTIILKLRFPNNYRSTEEMKELYALKLVSKAWKQLIEHTPWLWTYISADYPITVIQECLRLSRNHPLRIRVSSSRFHGVPKNVIQKLQLLQLHSGRWEELDYNTLEELSADGQPILEFLESPASNLHRLVASLPDNLLENPPTLNLAGGKVNQIKHLSLQNVFIPWSSELLTGLETFRLKVEGIVPVEGIVNVFVKSPGLQFFDLSYQGGGGQNIATLSPFANPTPFHVVANSLKKVNLCFDNPHIASAILSQVSMPACKTLNLAARVSRAMMHDIQWQPLSLALSQFALKIGPAMTEAGSTELFILSNSSADWVMSSQEEEFRFSFRFSGLPLYCFIECARDLAMTLESELELEVWTDKTSRSIVQELGEWSEITKLHAASTFQSPYENEGETLPDYLGQVQMNPSPGLSWPFPNLQELDLSELECPLLKIFDMLNRRYLPDSDLQTMEDLDISINSPPKLDLRVRDTLEWEDDTIVPAIEIHRGVRSLEYGRPEI